MTDHDITPQAAAIPIRDDGMVCLITTTTGDKWGIPKGMIDPGMTAEETAVAETWEEAGLRGELDEEPVGSFRYAKWGLRLEVTVFVLRVTEIDDDWPEAHLRERQWVSLAEAVDLVNRQEVGDILGMLANRS